jgi:hypothetical protein
MEAFGDAVPLLTGLMYPKLLYRRCNDGRCRWDDKHEDTPKALMPPLSFPAFHFPIVDVPTLNVNP